MKNKKSPVTSQESPTRDRRTFQVELRASDDTESRTVTGRAAVFNQWADLGWFREMIAPGAFTEALTKSDVRALFNHDNNHLLARTKSGTLKLTEDERGLNFSFDMPESREDILEMIRRGDLSECSFQFSMREGAEEWRYDEDGNEERIITKVGRLYDIALATFPAYEGTSIDLRSFEEFRSEQKENTEDTTEEETNTVTQSDDTTQEDDSTTIHGTSAKSRERTLSLLLHHPIIEEI